MSKTILIVDDSLYMRSLIKDALTGEGYEVVGEAGDVSAEHLEGGFGGQRLFDHRESVLLLGSFHAETTQRAIRRIRVGWIVVTGVQRDG